MTAFAAKPEPAMPANIDAEQGVLGTILNNNDVLAALGFLKAEHFSEEVHRVVFSAILNRVRDGQPATALTIAGDVPALSGVDLSPAQYVARLSASAWTTSEQIVGTARELVRLSAKRTLLSLAENVRGEALTPGLRADDIVARAETQLIAMADALAGLDPSQREASPDDILAEVNDRMISGRRFKGARSGIDEIDRKLGGFAPGEFLILAGRPGMGKTLAGLSLARRAAHAGTGVAFDSIEMRKTDVWHRLLSDEARESERIKFFSVARGDLQASQFERLKRMNENLKELPLVVLDRGNRLSDLPGHIRAARRQLAKKGKPLDLFIVDYLGLLQPGDRYAGQKVNEVGEISATLKGLARRENIAILALHQLSRENERRGGDFRPRLSDLRDSGNLEQDADVVMFVYREAYYIERAGYRTFATEGERLDALDEAQHRMEIIVAKQRQGDIARCRVWCDVATNSIRDEVRP